MRAYGGASHVLVNVYAQSTAHGVAQISFDARGTVPEAQPDIPAKTVIHGALDRPAVTTGSHLSWLIRGGRRDGK
jgi:hypothetical protein